MLYVQKLISLSNHFEQNPHMMVVTGSIWWTVPVQRNRHCTGGISSRTSNELDAVQCPFHFRTASRAAIYPCGQEGTGPTRKKRDVTVNSCSRERVPMGLNAVEGRLLEEVELQEQ